MSTPMEDTTTERVTALHELLARFAHSPSSALLEQDVRLWCSELSTPVEVVLLAAAVRHLVGSSELLDRVTVIGVTEVSERQLSAALTDPLTGLATRTQMAAEVQHLLATSWRAGTPLTAVMLDVDGLKRINDEQGHAAGDAALAEVGRAVRAHLRTADRAYRWGGDEFLLCLPGTSAAQAAQVVERVQDNCTTRISYGTAVHSDGTTEVDVATWLSKADADLYRRRAVARRLPAATPRRREGLRLLGPLRLLSLLALVSLRPRRP